MESHVGFKILVQISIAFKPRNVVAVNSIVVLETPHNQRLAVVLKNHAINCFVRSATRVEPGIQGSVGIESRDIVSSRAVYAVERSSNQHLPIRLQSDRIDHTIWTCIVLRKPNCSGVECGIQTSVDEQPRYSLPPLALNSRKITSDQQSPIGLGHD